MNTLRAMPLLCLSLLAPLVFAQTQWNSRSPQPTRHRLIDVTYGNGLFVAIGWFNNILTSPDAITWTSRSPEGPAMLTSVAYGNGKFLAVGYTWGDGEPVLRSSLDGLTWTEQSIDIPLAQIFFFKNLFVGKDQSTFFFSIDGQTWTQGFDGKDGISAFHAVGDTILSTQRFGDTSFLVSTNGKNWTDVPYPVPASILAATSGGGRFLAIARLGDEPGDPTEAWTSLNGTAWDRTAIDPHYFASVAFADGEFLLFGARCVPGPECPFVIRSSPDGRLWKQYAGSGDPPRPGMPILSAHGALIQVPGPPAFFEIAHAPSILTSTNRTNWTERIRVPKSPVSVATDGRTMVGLRSDWDTPNRVTRITRSTNGVDWTETQDLTNDFPHPIVYGINNFVAARSDGIYTSPDGLIWTRQPTAGTNWWQLRFSSGSFLALGYEVDSENRFMHHKFGISTNAADWRIAPLDTDAEITDVASDGSHFIMLQIRNQSTTNAAAVLLRSSDGESWVEVYRRQEIPPAQVSPQALIFGNGRFLAAGGSTTVLVSTNGLQWTSLTLESHCSAPIAANGQFFMAEWGWGSREFHLLSSFDGLNWKRQPTGLYNVGGILVPASQGLFAYLHRSVGLFVSGSGILEAPWDIFLRFSERQNSGTLSFQVSDPARRPFQIQETSTLLSPVWSTVPGTVDSADPQVISVPAALTATPRFYRAVVR